MRKPAFFSDKRSAFTLIEIILVMAITVFLLAATLQSTLSSTAQFTFINSYNKVFDLIREARSLAIAGKAQLDYTDFDKDKCTDVVSNSPVCSAPDYVTPAGYGVYFEHFTDAATLDRVTLFIDNHAPEGVPGLEGQYNKSGLPGQGGDIDIEVFTLPKGVKFFSGTLQDNDFKDSFAYTPIFADMVFYPALDPNNPSIMLGIQQQVLGTSRDRCITIHALAGVPESITCPQILKQQFQQQIPPLQQQLPPLQQVPPIPLG